MSNIAVTGAAGYIGGHIALRLKDAGHAVVGIDRRPLPTHLDNGVMSFLQADFDSDIAKKYLITCPRMNTITILLTTHECCLIVHYRIGSVTQ